MPAISLPTPELTIQGVRVDWPGRPLLMGIVNVTPDSFSDGGRFLKPDAAVAHGERLVADGADWLDVGGESTRPGAEPVALDEELRRTIPVIERLAGRVQVPISIDTSKAEVARQALAAGAAVINDVTGFRDDGMLQVAADSQAACVAMHMRGTPRTMRDRADYDDLMAELHRYFAERLARMTAAGIAAERIVLDPGVGFAKKLPHNLQLLARVGELHGLGRPLLVGASRKRIVGEVTGRPEPERLPGTIATAVTCAYRGVQILRVHDVRAVRDALAMVQAIESA